ncbi:MAG: hypothetical protein CL624_13255 [Arcobacter sp.]|nr:hypothetical protein [Arcobacter sp.]|tara:strand:- start:15091 stop:15273 length:183 start_codon:yes stop_codon:yes gene_type:complete
MLNINITEMGDNLDIQIHVEDNLDESKLNKIEKALNVLSTEVIKFARNKNKYKTEIKEVK